MVFATKLPLWEGLGEAVIRCAGGVEDWVQGIWDGFRGYGMGDEGLGFELNVF